MDHQTWNCPCSLKTNHALQNLIKSCRAQAPNGSNCQSQSLRFIDIQHACDELLSFSFHSEDGRLQLIEKLTTLDGNFVVKIIRKGLVSLSQVYSDSKTFEQECLKLVDLFCSQLRCVKRGYQNEMLLATPATIIEWTSELREELMTSEISTTRSIASLSSTVSKIKDLYESILRSSQVIHKEEKCILPLYCPVLRTEIFTFGGMLSILKPRIHSEGFGDVIEQTAAIVKTDVKDKPFVCATLLSKWLKLLKMSSVTNWFAAQVAKNDSVVHCESTREELNILSNTMSLICQVYDAIESLVSSDDKYNCVCNHDKERLAVLFHFPKVFLLRPKACLRLMQSREVSTKVVDDIFSIIADDLTKEAKDNADPYYFGSFRRGVEERARKLRLIDKADVQNDRHQKLSPIAITKALLDFPDKQQVLKILQIWKKNFPDDTSQYVLSGLFVLVIELIEMNKETVVTDMDHLIIFLPELCTKHKDALPLWITLLPSLIDALPNSWYNPENFNLMKTHVDKINQMKRNYYSTLCIQSFFVLLKSKPLSETAKTKIFRLVMDLLGEVDCANKYMEFIFYLILSLLSVMDIAQTKQYSLQLLKGVKKRGSSFHDLNPMINVIVAVRNSRIIKRKREILEDLLHLLEEARKGTEFAMLTACSEFLKFPVNTENTKRFFALTASGAYRSYQFILQGLYINFQQRKLSDCESINNHFSFLVQITNEKLASNASHLEQLEKATNIFRHNSDFGCPKTEIFETVVTAVAHDIALGTFDRYVNDAALRVTIAAADAHEQNPPVDFHSFYVHLNLALRKSRNFERTSFSYDIEVGLCLIARTPLTLEQIKCLIQRVMAIPHEQEFRNVLFKLIQLSSNGLISLLDPTDLYLALERLLAPTTVASVHGTPSTNLSHMDSCSIISIEQTSSSMEQTVKAISDMTRKKETEESKFVSTSQVIETIVNKVWETDLNEKPKDIEEMLLRVPPGMTPMISSCLRECYKAGFSDPDKPSIETLTEEALKNAANWKTLEI